MKSSKILFFFLVTVALATILSAKHLPLPRTGRFLADKPRVQSTCDQFPTVCRSKGSSGPDCCNKQCVDVMTDRDNCGKCGKKCGYSEMCCDGGCVKPSVDEKHCGRCNHRCNKGSSCVYGLCSYA
ncbi:hypothetical protein SLE2022_344610 [Rubroshorea leprosula]